MKPTETRRFTSWIIVRVRGCGPYTGSAWRVAAHVYRERALNLAGAVNDLQQDMHTWEDAYTELEQDRDRLRAALVRYGSHAGDCQYAWTNGACTCGWKEMSGEL